MSDVTVVVQSTTIAVTVSIAGVVVNDYYVDDDAAKSAGLVATQAYKLAENNNYTLPKGLVKIID
jgi:hypothetical protein